MLASHALFAPPLSHLAGCDGAVCLLRYISLERDAWGRRAHACDADDLRGGSEPPRGLRLAGVCVSATRQVMASEGEAGVAGVQAAATARTSARGEYFIAGLSPGGYSLSFRGCARPAVLGVGTSRAVVTGGQLTRVAP